MTTWLQRSEALLGKNSVQNLKNKKVVILGIGGVGSFTAEAIARSGIGKIYVVDKDIVDITNINRQLIATTKTIGLDKVKIVKDRILEINPLCEVKVFKTFVNMDNFEDIIGRDVDYVIDAIDTITSKIELAVWCNSNNINLISCMGAGNKIDPTKFEVDDIFKTSICPLAKVMRKELKKRNIKKLKVVYSKELPQKPIWENEEIGDYNKKNKDTPASVSFVPSVAGLIMAGEVIKDLAGY
ncbi:tRNA threonylcarbamoyladenosine dehydratase [Clostridium sediminicola]|uniref:tRNA threonylcarbamoyladenosine dehydratase n=1 Tax=Clostridium sediminicola TaxID=3114879 RepID=UPI0031F1D33F